MKTFFLLLSLITASSAFASGWLQLDVLPGSVLTTTGATRHIAIFREKGSMPATGYECTLSLETTREELARLAQSERTGTWTRWKTSERLSFMDQDIQYELQLDANRGSECLEWGPEYYEEGRPTRDCLRYAQHFRTMKSRLLLKDQRLNLPASLTCQRWMSDKKLETLDDFFRVIQKAESHFPLFLDAELD